MEFVKVALVAMAGLGSTWMARATTDALFGPPAVTTTAAALAQAAEEAPRGAATPAPAPTPTAAPPDVPQLTPEEMAAELRRAQAELAGKPGGDPEEFRATRPLAADLAIALPSDM